MALNATIYKAELHISDLDRHYYHNHHLTLALHPSETLERLMVRLLVFIIHANENLEFCKGLSTDDEPDLWQRNLVGEIEQWYELGQLDEKRVRKACHQSKEVWIYTYQPKSATVWWQHIHNKIQRFNNLNVIHLADETSKSLTELSNRNMKLQCTIEDGEIWLSDSENTVHIKPTQWK